MARNDRRGDQAQHTGRDPRTESRERMRRGGGSYDAGPGREGMPTAQMLDRDPSPCGAFERTGNKRLDYTREQRTIQDAEGHYREHR